MEGGKGPVGSSPQTRPLRTFIVHKIALAPGRLSFGKAAVFLASCFGLPFGAVPVCAEETGWEGSVDLAELQLDANGSSSIYWESALSHPLEEGTFHLEFDGSAEAFVQSEEVVVQAVYQLPVNSNADLWIGLEQDFIAGRNSSFLMVGGSVQWTQIVYSEALLLLGSSGDLYQQIKFIGTLPINEHWFLEPRAELNSAFQAGQMNNEASGVTDLNLSMRLRMRRPHGIAPYVGLSWSSALAETERLTRQVGHSASPLAAVMGAGWTF